VIEITLAESFSRQYRKGRAVNSVTKIGLAIVWDTPVWADTTGKHRKLVIGPAVALRFLATETKYHSGTMNLIAVQACKDALRGVGDLEASRAYFIAACDEEWVFNRRH
jgi:hypothetical protein